MCRLMVRPKSGQGVLCPGLPPARVCPLRVCPFFFLPPNHHRCFRSSYFCLYSHRFSLRGVPGRPGSPVIAPGPLKQLYTNTLRPETAHLAAKKTKTGPYKAAAEILIERRNPQLSGLSASPRAFCLARAKRAGPLPDFRPVLLPATGYGRPATARVAGKAAIGLWPDRIIGWKSVSDSAVRARQRSAL